MEARLTNLRLPLDSWHQNKFGGGFRSQFQVSVGPRRKTRQRLNWQFTDCLEKHDFLQMTPNIGNIYIY